MSVDPAPPPQPLDDDLKRQYQSLLADIQSEVDLQNTASATSGQSKDEKRI